jgi:lipopolysaccharide export system protein LptA
MTSFSRNWWTLVARAILLVSGLTGIAYAQSSMSGVPNAMQGFTQNRDQPIQIEAARLEVRDKKKQATFMDNVKVVQGDTTMTSKTLDVFYESKDEGKAPAPNKTAAKNAPIQQAAPGPTGSSSIKRLEARGNVVVTQKDQVVTGDNAIFDTKTNLITMTGGVVLTQCMNVLKGDRLSVDMTTGVSRVDADNGKVQGVFIQSGEKCASASPAAGPPSLLPGSSKPK